MSEEERDRPFSLCVCVCECVGGGVFTDMAKCTSHYDCQMFIRRVLVSRMCYGLLYNVVKL